MTFGSTPTDSINTPLGSVYVPNSASSNLTTLQGGTAHVADTNSQVSAPVATEEFIQAWIGQGQGFSVTTGQLSTATNTNIYIALSIFANNIAKNVLIYQWDGMLQQVYGDMQMTVSTTQDAAITNTLTPLNDSRGNSTTSLCTVKSTPAANTTPNATSGTIRRAYGSAANLGMMELIKQKNAIFIAAGQTQAITVWVKAPAAGNTGMFNASWIEF